MNFDGGAYHAFRDLIDLHRLCVLRASAANSPLAVGTKVRAALADDYALDGRAAANARLAAAPIHTQTFLVSTGSALGIQVARVGQRSAAVADRSP
jgi:hypothetical protein